MFKLTHSEFEVLKKRQKQGRRLAIKRGEFIASAAPYGYDKIAVNGKKTLRPNAYAKYVKVIFELRAEGRNFTSIARALTAMGAPTSTGAEWSRSTVRGILANPAYAGLVRWNGDLFLGLHEPIISSELFNAVQHK